MIHPLIVMHSASILYPQQNDNFCEDQMGQS